MLPPRKAPIKGTAVTRLIRLLLLIIRVTFLRIF
jgi:hypothetical protein